jgi:hypothetical protein
MGVSNPWGYPQFSSILIGISPYTIHFGVSPFQEISTYKWKQPVILAGGFKHVVFQAYFG